ncbi:MAG: LytTR family DNA-binding domain-containing protein [bacterium]|nr:LytTR family DNA-binding domain-containing protein [bacterium]
MKVLIIEDESRIAKRVERLTRDILGSNLNSLTVINTLQDGLSFIETNTLDVVLLDLNLNGEDGFDLLARTVSGAFHTIVVSANTNQALRAFEYGVLDFVPKPFNRDRLEQAFNRIVSEHKEKSHEVKYLSVKKRHTIQLVPIEDVIYIKGAGAYSELIIQDGIKELHDKSLEKLEQLLSPQFIRIHKSYLVKMSEVKEVKVSSGSKYLAVLKNGESIPIGRTKYKELREKWI